MSRTSYLGLKFGLVALLLMCFGAIGCQEQLADATVTNQAARTLMIQNIDFYNTGNMSMVNMLISPDYVGHYSSQEEDFIGIEGFKKWVRTNRASYSDFRVTIDRVVVEGEMVCLQWTVTGTHDGPMGEIPATGKRIKVKGLTLSRVLDGKIVEEWITWDLLGMYRQLGFTVMPPKI